MIIDSNGLITVGHRQFAGYCSAMLCRNRDITAGFSNFKQIDFAVFIDCFNIVGCIHINRRIACIQIYHILFAGCRVNNEILQHFRGNREVAISISGRDIALDIHLIRGNFDTFAGENLAIFA